MQENGSEKKGGFGRLSCRTEMLIRDPKEEQHSGKPPWPRVSAETQSHDVN